MNSFYVCKNKYCFVNFYSSRKCEKQCEKCMEMEISMFFNIFFIKMKEKLLKNDTTR